MSSDKESPNRKAIIVGVNQYEPGSDITTLAGPENDAREVYERFKNNGNFDISSNHLLLGPDATRRKILKAVSEIFRRKVNNDLVAFYFSGHGMLDENNEGYIAPYDMDPEDPYVSGINMEDLRNYISKSENKASVIILLDCCYAGIATKDGPAKSAALMDNPNTKNLYATQLQKIVKSSDQADTQNGGSGKIILASSEATAVSREKNNCTHLGKEDPHTHGAFTFHLIKGLDGEAADPDTGVIRIDSLRRYIENQMMAEERQRPMYYVADASRIESLKIGVSQKQFNTKIQNLIEDAIKQSSIKYPNSPLNDIRYLTDAAKRLSELVSLDQNNKDIPRLQTSIDEAVKAYFDPTLEWLNRNNTFAKPKVDDIKPGLYDFELPDLVLNLSFSDLQKMDQNKLNSMIVLCTEVARNTIFTSEDDPRLRLLQGKLRASFLTTKQSSAS